MAKPKRGLGRGLDALIPAGSSKSEELHERESSYPDTTGERVINVNLTQVEPNRDQPRKSFDEDSLQELADSIRQHGILNPLIVTDRRDHYELIAGERRWRAARMAGLKEVPIIVRSLSETEIAEVALIDNIQREDINPIEEAMAYRRLIDEFGYTQDVVAQKVSKSRVTITNSLRLLKLTDDVQQMVIDGRLSTGHVRTLIGVEDAEEQKRLAEQIFDDKLSVREAEKLINRLGKTVKARRRKQKNESLEASYRLLEERCKEAVGTKVAITGSGKGDGAGVLTVEFYSTDDLERITDRLMGRG